MSTPDRRIRLSALRGRRRRDIERELCAHLEDTRRELNLAGISDQEADRQSLERLGDMTEIADGFAHVYRTRWSTRLALAWTLAASLLIGAYSSGAFASGASARHAGTSQVQSRPSTHMSPRRQR